MGVVAGGAVARAHVSFIRAFILSVKRAPRVAVHGDFEGDAKAHALSEERVQLSSCPESRRRDIIPVRMDDK